MNHDSDIFNGKQAFENCSEAVISKTAQHLKDVMAHIANMWAQEVWVELDAAKQANEMVQQALSQ